MGVVNTSYTFTATDTITSAKMNNIIDDTIMTSTAVSGSTLQVTTSGQLAVNSQGITSNELASASVTQAKIGTNVAGTGPFIYANSSITTSVPTGITPTKITLNIISTDTNNNFANSRFTPTIAGVYQINCVVTAPVQVNSMNAFIAKNGATVIAGNAINAGTYASNASGMLYCNGSSDFIELFATHSQGTNASIYGVMNACLIRSL